jgi:hypothetical protein
MGSLSPIVAGVAATAAARGARRDSAEAVGSILVPAGRGTTVTYKNEAPAFVSSVECYPRRYPRNVLSDK